MRLTDPEVLRFVGESEAAYPTETYQASIPETRQFYDRLCEFFRAPRPDGVTVSDEAINGVTCRRYWPAGLNPDAPFVQFLHGGGFVVGSLYSHDDICAELSDRTGLEVVAVDYRLAPEHIYPAQLDDAEQVARALSSSGRAFVVVGDSAGGMLAAALCIRLRRTNGHAPLGQVLIYPALGGSLSLPSYTENANAPLLGTSDIAYYSEVYTGGRDWSASDDPELRPLACGDFAALPAAFIVTADIDPLRDDGAVYAETLAKAGVNATWRNEPQLVHSYLRARHRSARAKASFDAIIDAITSLTKGYELGN